VMSTEAVITDITGLLWMETVNLGRMAHIRLHNP